MCLGHTRKRLGEGRAIAAETSHAGGSAFHSATNVSAAARLSTVSSVDKADTSGHDPEEEADIP